MPTAAPAHHDAIPEVARIVAFIDNIEIKINDRPLTPTEVQRLKRKGGERVNYLFSPSECYRVAWAQPIDDELRTLLAVLHGRSHSIQYIELALDYMMSSGETLGRLREFLSRTLVMVDGHSDERRCFQGCRNSTVYFNDKHATVNLKFYSDAYASRKHVDEPFVFHLEALYRGAPAIGSMTGIRGLRDCLNFDHHGFWRRHLRCYAVPDQATLGERRIRLTPIYRRKAPKLTPTRLGNFITRAAGDVDDPHPQGIYEQSFGPELLDELNVTTLLPPAVTSRRRRAQSDLICKKLSISNALWKLIKPILPEHVNTHRFQGGRPRCSDRDCMTAILRVAKGATWRQVAALCGKNTAHDRMREWRASGVFERMRLEGLHESDELYGVDWSRLLTEGGYSDGVIRTVPSPDTIEMIKYTPSSHT
jgi:transposase